MVTMNADEFLTVDDVAVRMKVSIYTVKSWLRANRLRGYRLSGPKSEWRVRASALEEFVRSLEAQTEPSA